MSNVIFKWMPQLFDYEAVQEWRTIVSEFDNGMDQRQAMWQRPRGSWRFNYDVSFYNPVQHQKLTDEILTFFNARKGAYDNFFIPSWEMEYVLATPIVTATRIPFGSVSPADLGFSATRGAQGNYVFVCNAWYLAPGMSTLESVARITVLGGTAPNYYIDVEAPVVGGALTAYTTGAHVQKAFRVRFVNDKLSKAHDMPYVWKAPIEFMEDTGAV